MNKNVKAAIEEMEQFIDELMHEDCTVERKAEIRAVAVVCDELLDNSHMSMDGKDFVSLDAKIARVLTMTNEIEIADMASEINRGKSIHEDHNDTIR